MKAFQKSLVLPPPAKRYRQRAVRKPDGSKRLVYEPCEVLRQIQDSLLPELWKKLPASEYSHGRPGRSIVTHAKVHSNPAVLVTMDLDSFFQRVTGLHVKRVFEAAFPNTSVDRLVEYCMMPKQDCLATGAPTSPALADAVYAGADWYLAEVATSKGWRYSRYVDDMAFSLANPADDLVGRAESLISVIRGVSAAFGFPVNALKTQVRFPEDRQEVTGLIVNGGAPRAPRETWKRLRGGVHRVEVGRPVDLESLQGLLSFLQMLDKKKAESYARRLKDAVSKE